MKNETNATALRYMEAWKLTSLKVKDVSKATGVSQAMLYYYAKGEYIPTSAMFQLLHPMTGISPNYVLLGIGEPLTHQPRIGSKTYSIRLAKAHQFNKVREFFRESHTLEIHSEVWGCKVSEIAVTVSDDLVVFHKSSNVQFIGQTVSYEKWKMRNEK